MTATVAQQRVQELCSASFMLPAPYTLPPLRRNEILVPAATGAD